MELQDIKKAEAVLSEWNSNPNSHMCGNEYLETALYALSVVASLQTEVERLDKLAKEHFEIANLSCDIDEVRRHKEIGGHHAVSQTYLRSFLEQKESHLW